MKKDITFIDLFCGIGAFRLGLEAQGFKCVFSCDKDNACRSTYSANFGETPEEDITNISPKNILAHDVLCAGFPCQSFSIAGRQKGFYDVRGTLFFNVLSVIESCKPYVVMLENVKNLAYHNGGNTLSVICSSLRNLGYRIVWRVLNAADFGVPQSRERIFIIGTRERAFDIDAVHKTKRGCLNELLDAEIPESAYLDNDEFTLVNDVHKSVNGLIFCGFLNKCLRKNGVRAADVHLSRTHRQANRIYSADGLHPTLSAGETSGRYYILTQDMRVRKLTLNECWKLMDFPPDFRRVGSSAVQYHQLGNSICVPMVEAVAKAMKEQFFNN